MKNITDYLEKEQIDQVLAAAQQCNTRDYLIMRMLWRTGVRVNELLNIKPSDVEVHNSVVNITKAKGGKQRRVHLDQETIKMLSEYVSAQNLHTMIGPSLPSNNDRCGTSSSGMAHSLGRISIHTLSDTRLPYTVCETDGISGGSNRCSGIRI